MSEFEDGAVINVEVTPKDNINVVIGDCAKIDAQEAITYIESGKKEIEKAVDDGINTFDDNATQKTNDFNDNASDKTNDFNDNASDKTGDFNDNYTTKLGDFNTNATNKTNDFNTNATNKTNAFNDNAAIKQAAVDASAAEAKQWAIGDPTEPDGYSAKYWAGQAHSELSDLQSDVADIQAVIPSEASETNKLTDKDYVDTALALKANASNTVTTNTAQTISARKTFGDRIQRSSNIDQTSTTGTVEIQAFNVMDKNNNSVSMLNTVRLSTRNYQSIRAYNANVTGGNWMDLRVNIQDDGIGYVNIDKGANIENRNLTKSTSSKTDTYVATMGWVNDASKSTNVVHRDGTETITGQKTLSSTTQPQIIRKNSNQSLSNPTSEVVCTTSFRDGNDASIGMLFSYTATYGCGVGIRSASWGNFKGFRFQGDYSQGTTKFIVDTTTTQVTAPTDDNTTSTQIDTVGARNTKLQNYAQKSMFQVVASLPATPDPDTFYFIEES